MSTIPIFWRYLLTRFSKTLFVSLAGFLFILLSTRLEEAARLVGLGANLSDICLYILYQIPYVLQIALPISALIGAVYLFQRMSAANELTAARASGIGFFELILPLVLFTTCICLISFTLIFDISVNCHLAAKQLEYRLRETQPLAVLQNTRVLESRGVRYDMKGSLLADKNASDVLIAMNDPKSSRFVLIVGKKLTSTDQFLHGRELTVIGTRATDEDSFDTLFIENAKENVTPLKDLSLFTNKRKMWKAGNDYLQLPLLLAKKREAEEKITERLKLGESVTRVKKRIGQIWVEIIRRVSLALSIITLTLLGAAFGSSIGRHASRTRFAYVFAFVALFLVCYLAAKGIQDTHRLPIFLYLLPHVVIITVSLRRLSHLQKGIELS